MNITDVPLSCWGFFISFSICAWIVTSSAVVGSSAIRSFGSHISAIAIIILCNIPPLISNGYCSYLFSAGVMPIFSNISMTFSLASRRFKFFFALSISAICSPAFMIGSREVIGSWNIIAAVLPLKSRSCFLLIARTSFSPLSSLM